MPKFLVQAKRPGAADFTTRNTILFDEDTDGTDKKERAARKQAEDFETRWRHCGTEPNTDFHIVRERW